MSARWQCAARHFPAMHRLAALLLPILAFAAAPAMAQVIVHEEVIEEEYILLDAGADRFVEVEPVPLPAGIAAYGPFRVLDGSRAALVDVTDARSADQFAAMLRAWPGIGTIEMLDCPGTEDDRANLRIGRMIRARGIATHVPAGGSVRSGAVELFLAGARRIADPGAEFAVHAWADEDGLEPQDYPESAPENRDYIAYYQTMGMTADEARAFYAMTNSVHHQDAKWLTAAEMGQWVKLDPEKPARLALADLDAHLDGSPSLH